MNERDATKTEVDAMRVLLGKTAPGPGPLLAREWGVQHALEFLGHEVLTLDLPAAREESEAHASALLVSAALKTRATLFLTIEPEAWPPEVLEALRLMGTRTVAWGSLPTLGYERCVTLEDLPWGALPLLVHDRPGRGGVGWLSDRPVPEGVSAHWIRPGHLAPVPLARALARLELLIVDLPARGWIEPYEAPREGVRLALPEGVTLPGITAGSYSPERLAASLAALGGRGPLPAYPRLVKQVQRLFKTVAAGLPDEIPSPPADTIRFPWADRYRRRQIDGLWSRPQEKPTVSLVMIVKDEAEMLPACLESFGEIADEAVIVDTGSTDATMEIARAHGARVLERPWDGDFSAARNLGLDEAQGDWFFSVDADEVLDLSTSGCIQPALRSTKSAAFYADLTNFLDKKGEIPIDTCRVLRLVRNIPAHRFTGRVHEQVAASLTGPVEALPIMIRHFGYRPEVVERRNKVQRNLQLLQAERERLGDDPFLLMNLGREYQRSGDHVRALETYERARSFENVRQLPFYTVLVHYSLEVLTHLGRWQEALALAEASLVHYPHFSELYYFKAMALVGLEDRAQAGVALLWALAQPKVDDPALPYRDPVLDARAWALLGDLYLESGQAAKALAAWKEALAIQPSNVALPFRIARVLANHEPPEAITRYLLETIAQPNSSQWQAVHAVYLREMGPEAALSWARRAQRAGEEYSAQWLAFDLLCLGRVEEARAQAVNLRVAEGPLAFFVPTLDALGERAARFPSGFVPPAGYELALELWNRRDTSAVNLGEETRRPALLALWQWGRLLVDSGQTSLIPRLDAVIGLIEPDRAGRAANWKELRERSVRYPAPPKDRAISG